MNIPWLAIFYYNHKDMEKSLLVIVDYQVDFVSGTLGFPLASSFEDKIINLIKEKEKEGYTIVFTKDIHDGNYLETEEGKNFPIPHCIRNTPGSEIYGKLNGISKSYKIFEKETFGSYSLARYMHEENFTNIELCGIDTSICVLSNAILAKSSCPNARVSVISSCSGSGDKNASEIAYKALERIHIHKI